MVPPAWQTPVASQHPLGQVVALHAALSAADTTSAASAVEMRLTSVEASGAPIALSEATAASSGVPSSDGKSRPVLPQAVRASAAARTRLLTRGV